MAMWYKPRQKQSDGKWHMTAGSDEDSSGYAYAIGYCAKGCPGHDTQEAAYKHWEEYILDNEVKAYRERNEQKRCLICSRWTNQLVEVGRTFPYYLPLCSLHESKEIIIEQYMKMKHGEEVSCG